MEFLAAYWYIWTVTAGASLAYARIKWVNRAEKMVYPDTSSVFGNITVAVLSGLIGFINLAILAISGIVHILDHAT